MSVIVSKSKNRESKAKPYHTARTKAFSILILATSLLLTSCGSSDTKSVEDEVSERLIESIEPTDLTNNMADASLIGDNARSEGTTHGTTLSDLPNIEEKTDKTVSSPTATARGTTSKPATKATEKPQNLNPFLGDTSTATDYNIKFKIETDSGVAGITFGSNDGTRAEYYLFAFDCTRDVPRLYTSRRIDDAVYDEEYTYLDFMYPEMQMFTDVQHIIEIKVSGNTATTYLDSYKVCDTALKEAKPCGQIGTWVMDGNYHEYIDDLFVAEGIEGDGEWIYSDDFSRASNLFYPDLKTRSGKLYATTGYYTAPSKSPK